MNAIIIPTYNEAQNLPTLVNEIFHLDLDTKIIFIDDNSPDGTGKLADELAKKNNVVIWNDRKLRLIDEACC